MSFEADAAVYDRHVGRYAAELSAAHIAAARVVRDDHVLDVGCGPGGLTRALADFVGAENVAAVDPSKSFVAACEARVRGADVREGAAESLPFDNGVFDFVLGSIPDRPSSLGRLLRFARPQRQEALRVAVFRRLGEPAGPFTLTARAWFARGSA